MRVAVIPARGGSKRVPRKNIKLFCGKPMLAWSIEAARASGCFDKIIVSTDDVEIAEIAVALGAETPFLRPPELSDDHTGTIEVIAHAVDWLVRNGFAPSEVCCIYATAPFIRADDLKEGLRLLTRFDCDYAFTVTSYAFPIQRAIRIIDGSSIQMFHPEHFDTRSQDLEETFHDAGQFYWGHASAWIACKPLFCKRSLPIILPRYRVQDIDTQEDWTRAEFMFKAMQGADKFEPCLGKS